MFHPFIPLSHTLFYNGTSADLVIKLLIFLFCFFGVRYSITSWPYFRLNLTETPDPHEWKFYDEIRVTAWCRYIEEHTGTILTELQSMLDQSGGDLPPYFHSSITTRPQSWRTLGLWFWNMPHSGNSTRFPKTAALFQELPGDAQCVCLSFSQLEPGAAINPHYGDSDATYRCHLGLIIPSSLPLCGFQCGGEQRSWVPGQVLAFNDSQLHTAFNHTDSKRFIVNFDVLRPQFSTIKHWICMTVLTKILLMAVCQRHSLNYRSGWVQYLVFPTVRLIMAIPVVSGLGSGIVWSYLVPSS